MPIQLSKQPQEVDREGRTVEFLRKEDVLVEWKAREFIQYDKNPVWMSVVYLIAVLLFIYAIWTMNFLFAILIILSVIVIYLYTKKKPRLMNVAVMKKGFRVDDTLYTYEDDLENFWVLYSPPDLKTLFFKRKQSMFPNLVIQLEDQNPMRIRELLLEHLPEDVDQDESVIDKFSRRVGF